MEKTFVLNALDRKKMKMVTRKKTMMAARRSYVKTKTIAAALPLPAGQTEIAPVEPVTRRTMTVSVLIVGNVKRVSSKIQGECVERLVIQKRLVATYLCLRDIYANLFPMKPRYSEKYSVSGSFATHRMGMSLRIKPKNV
ncbi:hypothetical protein HYZ99_01350 [Candidatus Peregrinibacteria bacterium]|nr:hypothetical protein [Candidatus Peregrinibacteria bacterium]